MYFNINCIGKLPGPTNEFERSLVFETGEFERPKFDCSTRIIGFHQLWLIGNRTDLESLHKTSNARYQASDPWSARTTAHMLRETDRQTDRQTDRHIHVEQQGSNLALANMLNASSFPQNASRSYHHLLF